MNELDIVSLPNVSRRLVFVGVGLIAGASLFLEIALTRYFSFHLWYHYAFMIISVAMLGLSSASVSLGVFTKRVSSIPPGQFLSAMAFLMGVAVLLSLPVLAFLNSKWVAEDTDAVHIFTIVILYWLTLAIPFFFAGAAISWSIQLCSDQVNTLYAFDLIGAATGSLAAILVLSHMYAEQAMALSAAIAFFASLVFARRPSPEPTRVLRLVFPILGLLGATFLCFWGEHIVGSTVTPTKGLAHDLSQGGRIVTTVPSMNGRVDVIEGKLRGFAWGLDAYQGSFPPQFAIRIDGDALTSITQFHGDFSEWAFTSYMPGSLPYALKTPSTVLIIGPGGGMDVVNAVGHGAKRVVGVEVNEAIIGLIRGPYANFSGNIYTNPHVTIVNSDGRNFIERTPPHSYDLVQLTLVDTFAAISSGALSLSEDFLYTKEAIQGYIRALTPDGYLVLGRTVFEGIPLMALLDAADAGNDPTNLGKHILMMDKPPLGHSLVMLYKRSPLTMDEIQRGLKFGSQGGFRLRYAPNLESISDRQIVAFLHSSDRKAFLDQFGSDLRPETDDRPFYFRDSKWTTIMGTYSSSKWTDFLGASHSAKGNLLLIFGVAVLFSFFGILLPLRRRAQIPLRGYGGELIYFALIGMGYIILEIALLTKFSLFLGHPVRALAVTLVSLLLLSGVGSAFSPKVANRFPNLPFMNIAVFSLLCPVILPLVFHAWMGLDLFIRICLSILVISPLAFFMGMPMPIGLSDLHVRKRSLTLWAWGLNGTASVIGSVAAVILAHAMGYNSLFLIGALCYLIAAVCRLRIRPEQ